MSEERRNTVIGIDVTLHVEDELVLFRYRGTDEISRWHVDEKGNIDLCNPDDLGQEAVDLCFRLQVPQIILADDTRYPSFAASESIWITEAKYGSPTAPYRRRGILARCGLRAPQFYGYANPEPEARSLRFSDRNDDGKEYKYTLRVLATGPKGECWLQDDPRIKNRGGHLF